MTWTGQEGDTALIVAARVGHYEICVDLIEAGARIDLPNKIGITALMEACRYGHRPIVQLLIYSDADLDLTDTVCLYSTLLVSVSP
jgi:uncharacterized protein